MTTNIVAVKKNSISTGTSQEGFRANQAEIGLKRLGAECFVGILLWKKTLD
jgi:hypothetical protein